MLKQESDQSLDEAEEEDEEEEEEEIKKPRPPTKKRRKSSKNVSSDEDWSSVKVKNLWCVQKDGEKSDSILRIKTIDILEMFQRWTVYTERNNLALITNWTFLGFYKILGFYKSGAGSIVWNFDFSNFWICCLVYWTKQNSKIFISKNPWWRIYGRILFITQMVLLWWHNVVYCAVSLVIFWCQITFLFEAVKKKMDNLFIWEKVLRF